MYLRQLYQNQFYNFIADCSIQLMEKLGEVTIDNSLTLTVSYQVDQHLLAKNFTTIVNALKDLQISQQKTESQLKELYSLKDKYDQLGLKVDKLEKHSKDSQGSGQSGSYSQSDLESLAKRVQKNEGNIDGNIKDINLINKDLIDLKKLIQDLKNRISNFNSHQNEKAGNHGYGVEDIASNLSKQLSLSSQKMKELEVKLMKAEQQIGKHEKDIKQLIDSKDKNKGGQTNNASTSNKSNNDLEDLKRDLKQKLEIINRKISNLQSDSDNHDQDINEIKDILAEKEENKPQEQNPTSQTKQQVNISKEDFLSLKKKLDELDRREIKDIKNLLEEINNLKQQLKNQIQKSQSRSKLEDQGSRTNRRPTPPQRDDLADKISDLIMRVSYLQKLMAGSKNSLNDEKNPQKLPTINRTRRRDQNLTVYQEKQKSGISRKDLAELKAELEAWIKGLFDQNKDRQNFQDLDLKIQEIKKALEKKADAEGTKKGFAFLENKITQLYLFLTEPDTEDAMIVRKGFNCLSCSKKVEKLRGRIGPKLNWNNMTTTNYSPPKVGYSKPMGDSSIQKDDA